MSQFADILVVEDDAKIADMLTNYLHMYGYTTAVCGNGIEAVAMVRNTPPALVLLDLMLPGQDGLAVCQQVRAFSAVPIMMLTARVDEIDRLLGLDTGADDYVCKPFSPREVVARVKALLRRAHGVLASATAPQQQARLLENRIASQVVAWQGKALPLTPVEYRLLVALMVRPEQVFSRAQLLDHVHNDLRDVSDRAVDSHIKNIRRKLEAAGALHCTITSVYGAGYRFELLTG
jgi:two-component system, OmpR family, response regulator BaeR